MSKDFFRYVIPFFVSMCVIYLFNDLIVVGFILSVILTVIFFQMYDKYFDE